MKTTNIYAMTAGDNEMLLLSVNADSSRPKFAVFEA